MRGHIVKRGKNSYSIAVSVGKDGTTGKYKYQWVTVKGTKKEAEQRLSEILHQLDNGTFIKPGKTTLAEYLERWLKEYAWPNLAPRTAEGYETIVRQHLIPKLGNLPLTQLKPEHLQKYYSEMLRSGRCDSSCGLSAQTVRHHHTALHKALQTAVEWGLLSRNVADAVKPPHAEHHEMQTWGEDDIIRFLEAAKATPYYALFYTALFTGMRRSEFLALRWSDIDLFLCQVYVNRSLHQLRDGSIIYRALLLQEHKEKQEAQWAVLGISLKDDDLVFSTIEGKPLRPNTISRAWTMLVARAGVKVIRLHDARHTHASLMLKQGVHPKIVQERLGHATIAITLDTYSHVAPGLQEAAAVGFDKMVFPRREDEPVKNDY
jgi:integrase